jgi:DNA modification methylase
MVKKVNISAIKPNEENPRFITDSKFKKLVKSIKEFPEMLETRPLVVDENMIVLGGNMRLKALKSAGVFEVPVHQVTGWTEDQKKEFIIKDNLGYGEWDWDIVANDWDLDKLNDWGLDLPDLGDELIDQLEASEDHYEEPDDLKVDVKQGDIIEIGKHKVYCASSTEKNNWEKLMNGKTIDLIITDPPYNVDYQGSNGLKIMNDKMSNDSFYQFLYDFYVSANEFLKKGGAWYVWHADSEGHNFRMAMKNAGILLKQCIIWVKNSLVLGRQDYQWQHEPCLYGWKEGAAHYFVDERYHTTIIENDELEIDSLNKNELKKLVKNIYSDYIRKSVIKCDKPKRNDVHPTMKPIKLLEPLIKNSSKENELIADGFLGSGSTIVAAHQLKRICYGMELDPKYCQVIIDRMQKLDPNLTVKINGKNYDRLLQNFDKSN